MYRPSDIFYEQFTTNNQSGISTNADLTPWATMVKNGIDDAAVRVFVTNVDVGRYILSGTIPATYAKGQSIGIIISGYVSSNFAKNYITLGQLDSKYVGDLVDANGNVNANMVTVSGRLVAPGLSGSITSDLRFVNGYPAVSYQGIAQTGGLNYIRLASTEPSINDYYKNQYINIVLGKGVYQQAIITSYSGSTRDAYVRTPYANNQWLTIPDNTSAYVLNGLADVNLVSSNSGGLDGIIIENGVNLRQWASIVGAAIAGSSTVSGNSISYYAMNNNSITRVSATAISGARQTIVLYLP